MIFFGLEIGLVFSAQMLVHRGVLGLHAFLSLLLTHIGGKRDIQQGGQKRRAAADFREEGNIHSIRGNTHIHTPQAQHIGKAGQAGRITVL